MTHTTQATADTVVTAGAFTADGTSAYLIEFYSYSVIPGATAAGRNVSIQLFDGATAIGTLGIVQTPAAAATVVPVRAARRLVPANASKTYAVKAIVNAGTGTIDAGAGGSGVAMPGYIRITKVT